MAILDASNSEITFSSTVSYASLVEQDTALYSWLSADPGHQIRAFGTGFTYSGATPTGGTVTSLSFDFVNSTHPFGFTDAVITGLSVPLADLVNLADPAAGEVRFWEVVLAGNDTIHAPLAAGGRLFGDFLTVQSGLFDPVVRTGQDDIFFAAGNQSLPLGLGRGDEGSANALIGDAVTVDGAAFLSVATEGFLTGGNDEFFVSKKAGFTVVGDVLNVGYLGSVQGGDDTVNSTIDAITVNSFGKSAIYIGDVENNFGDVAGGADIIRGSNFAFLTEALVGDVFENGERAGTVGVLRGGADVLTGRAGQDLIAGDVYRMNGGTMTGGNDLIQGGEDSDIISGDVLHSIGLQFVTSIPSGNTSQLFTTINMTGGDDTLSGGNGNDWIVGDLWNGDGIKEPSSIIGGDDRILGGDGDDMLYGDVGADYAGLLDQGGDDVLDGGLGDDIIDGQLGQDTASFASVAIAVSVDLAAGTATGQGNDLLAGIENITGSSRSDSLSGDTGRNLIDGGEGADVLNGRDGNDQLSDGTGRDILNGGNGVDAFVLAADGMVDVFNGGNDADALNLINATSNVTITFSGVLGNGTVTGGGFGADTFTSIEFVAGSDGGGLVDTVIGSGGSQMFFLRRGNDVAEGRGGDDAIAGEGGNDRLDGGSGNDILNGGVGADTLVFSAILNAATNVDTIEDFDVLADVLELGAAVFSGLAAGALGAAAFVKGAGLATAQDASDRIIYNSTTGELYFDADGTGGGSTAVKFAILDNHPSNLNAGDFIVA